MGCQKFIYKPELSIYSSQPLMDKRKIYIGVYRYGFNGQEMDDEVAGDRNTYTAEFWEYDARIGRRFNLDPKTTVSISPYACFANSPISMSDHKGDSSKYYSTKGDLLYTSHDKLENAVVVIPDANLERFKAMINNVEKRGKDFKSKADFMKYKSGTFMNIGLRSLGTQYMTEGFIDFFDKNRNDIYKRPPEGAEVVYYEPKNKKDVLHNEHGTYLVVSQTKVRADSKVNIQGGYSTVNRDGAQQPSNAVGFLHIHPDEGIKLTRITEQTYETPFGNKMHNYSMKNGTVDYGPSGTDESSYNGMHNRAGYYDVVVNQNHTIYFYNSNGVVIKHNSFR